MSYPEPPYPPVSTASILRSQVSLRPTSPFPESYGQNSIPIAQYSSVSTDRASHQDVQMINTAYHAPLPRTVFDQSVGVLFVERGHDITDDIHSSSSFANVLPHGFSALQNGKMLRQNDASHQDVGMFYAFHNNIPFLLTTFTEAGSGFELYTDQIAQMSNVVGDPDITTDEPTGFFKSAPVSIRPVVAQTLSPPQDDAFSGLPSPLTHEVTHASFSSAPLNDYSSAGVPATTFTSKTVSFQTLTRTPSDLQVSPDPNSSVSCHPAMDSNMDIKSTSMKVDLAASLVFQDFAHKTTPVLDEDDRTITSADVDPAHTYTYGDDAHDRDPELHTFTSGISSCFDGLPETAICSPLRFSPPLPSSSPTFDSKMSADDESIGSLQPAFSSSPVRSSTPDLVFSSSPERTSPSWSLPTSSPENNVITVRSSVYGIPDWTNDLRAPKRTRSATDIRQTTDLEGPTSKRRKLDVNKLHGLKRPTVASQHDQYQKLKTPFRSPVTLTTKDTREKFDSKTLKPETKFDVPLEVPPAPATRGANKAASQFKSPLVSNSSLSVSVKRSVGAAPNIQALQRRVQLLKRAIRIKNGGDEEKLGELMKKWTVVGREVAWEIWGVVKESIVPGESSGLNKGGWDHREKQNSNGFGDSWGWNESEVTEDGEETRVKEDTMGTMLRQMKIDPDTLGWDEEEGEFVDH